jgi:hypothetical protein
METAGTRGEKVIVTLDFQKDGTVVYHGVTGDKSGTYKSSWSEVAVTLGPGQQLVLSKSGRDLVNSANNTRFIRR